MKDWIEDHFTGLATIGIVVGALLLIVVAASQEARTFNKLTHRTDVTTWDALWVSLRVDCTPTP